MGSFLRTALGLGPPKLAPTAHKGEGGGAKASEPAPEEAAGEQGEQCSSKRKGKKAGQNAAQAKGTAACQVPDCGQECPQRVYYQRHRICTYHSSISAVVIDGRGLRWCQQCGRFQDLEEFEGEKKTCRRVLEAHNARRRKRTAERAQTQARVKREAPQPMRYAAGAGSPTSSSCTTTRQQGASRGGALGSPRLARAGSGPAASNGPSCGPAMLGRASSLMDSAQEGVGGARSSMVVAPSSQSTGMETWGTHSQAGGAAGPRAMETDNMLGDEEISSRMLDELANDTGLQELLGWFPDLGSLGPPLVDTAPPLLGQDSLEQLLRRQCQEAAAQDALRAAQPVAAAAAGPAAADAYRGTSLKRHMARPSPSPFGSAAAFCSVPGGSLHAAAQQAGWPAEASMGQAQQPAVSGSGSAMAEPAADLLPFSFVPGPTLGLHPLPWPTSPAAAPQQPAASGSPGLPVAQPAASAAAATTCMERAASTVAAPAGNEEALVRLSLKLFNVSPWELPTDVRTEVAGLITTDPAFVESFVRPGCTHVTVAALLGAVERSTLQGAGAKGVAQQLLERNSGKLWASDMLVQLNDEVAVVCQGRVAVVVRMDAAVPRLVAARPAALFAPFPGPAAAADSDADPRAVHCHDSVGSSAELDSQPDSWSSGGAAAAEPAAAAGRPGFGEGAVMLWGYNLANSQDLVICRQGGRVINLDVIARGKVPAKAAAAGCAAAAPPEWVLVRPLRVAPGLVQFEVQHGGMLSHAVSVAALPSRAAVAEAQQAQRELQGLHAAEFVRHLGIAIQHLPAPGAAARALHPRMAALAARLLRTARAHGWAELACLLEDLVGGDEGEEEEGEAAPAVAAPTAAAEPPQLTAACACGLDEGGACSMAGPSRQAYEIDAAADAACASTATAALGVLGAPGEEEDVGVGADEDDDDDDHEMFRRLSKGSDIGDWVMRQLRVGRFGTGAARRTAAAPALVAALAAAAGGTLLMRNVLGEVE